MTTKLSPIHPGEVLMEEFFIKSNCSARLNPRPLPYKERGARFPLSL